MCQQSPNDITEKTEKTLTISKPQQDNLYTIKIICFATPAKTVFPPLIRSDVLLAQCFRVFLVSTQHGFTLSSADWFISWICRRRDWWEYYSFGLNSYVTHSTIADRVNNNFASLYMKNQRSI